MKFSLRQIEVFLATCHHENISKAASELAMSQSAASGALKELENQFSIQLFDRVGKRLHLNDSGRSIQTRAEALHDSAKELEMELSRHERSQSLITGELKVGATLTVGNYLAVGLVDQFLKQYPQTRVSLEIANTSEILDQLVHFKIDVGFIEGEYHHPDLDIQPWMQDKLSVFCSTQHPYAKKESLSDDDIINAKWILREPGSGTRQTFDRAMTGLNPSLNILLELQHTEAIKRAVTSGMGISCLSDITIQDEIERGELIPLNLHHRSLERYFYRVLHKQKYVGSNLSNWLTMCDSLKIS